MQLQHAGYIPIAPFYFICRKIVGLRTSIFFQEKGQQSFLAKYPNNEAALKASRISKKRSSAIQQIQKVLWVCILYCKKRKPSG